MSVALTLVLVAVALGAYGYYRYLDDRIPREPIDPGTTRPPDTGALNVLLVGSDSREGDNKKYGATTVGAGERTDTIMLLHIAPNRDGATMISFPRDSMVQIPECKGRNGAVLAAGLRQVNSAFNDGGINCTIKTLESLTNIKIDHFVKVDFTGFKGIIDALGGIEICLPKAVNDKEAKFVLGAGRHTVNGEQALGYVRTRYSLGDGSDLSRIERQQIFLTQVMKKVTDGGLLTDPGKLNAFLQAATQAVTVDDGLGLDRMLEIARSVSGLTAKELKGITVPTEPYPENTARVQFAQPAARDFFEAVRNDTDIKPTASAARTSAPKIEHEQVRLQVLNATGEQGKALQVADALAAQGFVVTQVGNAAPADTTTIRYAKKDATDGPAYGDAVAARLSKDKRTPVQGKVKAVASQPYELKSPPAQPATGPVIQLVIGKDWPGVRVQSAIPDALKDKVVDSNTDPCK
ncbi:LCP family protein [Nonomuraea gerenzanensis]|uniref:Cell envelope-associated transcriptional attenuator LytR-CpsA-Psr, subfamily A1 (As in PMID19099556) n=1 Tax=Nonomuraea gerenzanensis TaxID=93944 RepID=A0A1M4EJV8_9ACTN|nr:LCP family protein [Nonomuraea gerenzanensis]UBU10708.1 LCP family protein [Nonomuraea gerenzanensis]SBO99130.1 Cell envelope-associated transcriptional attenuator LytR-CpsA-Psr, subfamily A1 (as in PMID19099556) [Nonomuraea gerenzanensis]